MKKLLFALATLVALNASAQGLKTPAASPGQTISQDFGLSKVTINYSRPAMKGRKIFGDLVPFGAQWRTGANGPTTITFGEDVNVGGKDVKAGTYSILSVPGKSTWEIKLAKEGTSVFDYKDEAVVTTFTVPSTTLPFEIENFTIMTSDITANSMNIQLLWSNVMVQFPVKVDVDAKIMGEIENVMNKDSKPYFQAASYYFENGKDLNKALEWATKAADAQPDAYWVKHLLAKVQAKAGKKTEAIATAKASMALAEKGGNQDYVKLNQQLISSLK